MRETFQQGFQKADSRPRAPVTLLVCLRERCTCAPAGPMHAWDGAHVRVRVRAAGHACVSRGSALGLWAGSLLVGPMAGGGPLGDWRCLSGCGGTAGRPRVTSCSEGTAMNSSALRTFNLQDEISSACAFSLWSHPGK